VNAFLDYAYQIQKSPPLFVQQYRSGTLNVEEQHFRGDFERAVGLLAKAVSAEARHVRGRTDLTVSVGEKAHDILIAELKVWGRNDYKDVVLQLVGYITEFQSTAVVFMVNENAAPLRYRYARTVIFDSASYIHGSFRERPIAPTSFFEHYYSRHVTPSGGEVGIFHFVVDAMIAKTPGQ
jgi:hypothetical protein